MVTETVWPLVVLPDVPVIVNVKTPVGTVVVVAAVEALWHDDSVNPSVTISRATAAQRRQSRRLPFPRSCTARSMRIARAARNAPKT